MRATFRRRWGLAAGLGALALLSACIPPSYRPPVDSLDQVGADEVVVAGRVYLNPPLQKGEQRIQKWGIDMGVFHHAYLRLAERPWGDKDYPEGTALGPLDGSIQTDWNQWFFVRMPRHDFYIQMLTYYTDVSTSLNCASCHTVASDFRRAYMPADLKVSVQPSDRVIFIGSLVFYRDEFNHPMGLRAIDDLARIQGLVTQRFGVPARLALPQK